MSTPTTASQKAIMFFADNCRPGHYDHDVFLWNSVDGVRRMTFGEYLALVEAPHDSQYKLVRVSTTDLHDAGTVVQKDADFIRHHVSSANVTKNDDKTYMAFRSVWHAATGDVMPL